MTENYKNCEFCNSFPNGLWNFVQSYLNNIDIDNFQSKYVDRYYCNLILNFLNTEFFWSNGKPKEYNYRFVKDLPEDMKIQAIDCVGVSLGWGPKSPDDKYISNGYEIYKKYLANVVT